MKDENSIFKKFQNRVDYILQKLNNESDIHKVRIEIADLILEHLELVGNSLDYYKKMYFANAISALACNINSSHKPPLDSWLRICLVSLENAFIPPEHWSAKQPPRNSQFDAITFDQLIEAINEIRTRLLYGTNRAF